MLKLLMLSALIATSAADAETLQERVVHNDSTAYRLAEAPHDGAGPLNYTGMLNSDVLESNFLFLHAGVLLPKGGIGHHFHHKMEEMYVILNGEAEFTINGRTSRLKGPIAVPCKMGQSHAIYNHTDEPLQWLNFAVSQEKGRYDAFNLGDSRVGALLDRVAIFVSAPLGRDQLRDSRHRDAEAGILYQRALRRQVFSTSWAFLDHMLVPAGKETTRRTLDENEEVWYVMKGAGTLHVGREKVAIKAGDAIALRFGEEVSFANDGQSAFELVGIGIEKSE